MRTLRSLWTNDRGQDLAEYGIALAIIAVGAGALAAAIGADVQTLWNNAHEAIHAASGGSH